MLELGAGVREGEAREFLKSAKWARCRKWFQSSARTYKITKLSLKFQRILAQKGFEMFPVVRRTRAGRHQRAAGSCEAWGYGLHMRELLIWGRVSDCSEESVDYGQSKYDYEAYITPATAIKGAQDG